MERKGRKRFFLSFQSLPSCSVYEVHFKGMSGGSPDMFPFFPQSPIGSFKDNFLLRGEAPLHFIGPCHSKG